MSSLVSPGYPNMELAKIQDIADEHIKEHYGNQYIIPEN